MPYETYGFLAAFDATELPPSPRARNAALERVRLGEQISKEEVGEEGRDRAETGDDDSQDNCRQPHHGRASAVTVGDPTPDGDDPTVPLRPVSAPHASTRSCPSL